MHKIQATPRTGTGREVYNTRVVQMDGWMDDLQFYVIFIGILVDGWMIMKGCMQWNPVYG